jgi:hypothetical protein
MTPETIKLQVGQTWLTGLGDYVTLVEFEDDGTRYPFRGDNGIWYTSQGQIASIEKDSARNLRELVSTPINDQPEPTPQFEYFPPALFTEWLQHAMEQYGTKPGIVAGVVAHKAAQYAADQELQACEEWLLQEQIFSTDSDYLFQLRAARRPKQLSLAQQATADLDDAVMRGDCITTTDAMPSLRAALKRLSELEAQR